MIRVNKPSTIPKHLATKGVLANSKNCLAYNSNRKLFIKEVSINPEIYNHPSVKIILKRAQYSKCCYCEKDQTDEYGAVEHYRPKHGYKSFLKENLKKPGYYWQGYEWDNLYFVCSSCNTAKGNLFPLADESKRAKSHKMDIKRESPLLLNPGGSVNPRDHIVFDNQFPKGKTRLGKKTIEICNLKRDSLTEDRKKVLDNINFKIIVSRIKDPKYKKLVKEANNFIINCQKPASEFSSAAIDFITKSKSK